MSMRKPGEPISDEERRSKTLKHILHWGLKMMVRSDLGGREVKDMPQYFAEQFNGKTAVEAGVIAADFVKSTVEGVRMRQSRTIAEVERRAEDLRSSLIKAFEHYKTGDFKTAAGIIGHSVARTLNGEQEKDLFPSVDTVVRQKISPAEHVLN